MKRKILTTICLIIGLFLTEAQTYTVKVTFNASSANCHAGSFNWEFRAGGVLKGSYDIGGNSFGTVGETRTYTVNNYNDFSLTLKASCIPLNSSHLDCSVNETLTKTASDLIVNPSLSISSCNGSVSISYFKPNIGVFYLNNIGDEVCIGKTLDLGATSGFPVEAYRWQYSIDYQGVDDSVFPAIPASGTWQNFPFAFNASSQVSLTLQELLGNNHDQYLNQNIYIRVGYNNRPFSNATPIFYSACSPLVTSFNYAPPDCTGDAINLTVNLDRPLDVGEEFSQISIVDANQSISYAIQYNVTTDIPNGSAFTFYNVTGLEEGHDYIVAYQMTVNNVLVDGYIYSAQTFTFLDAIPVRFLANGNTIDCFGDNSGSISISASGGTGSYLYSINNGTNWFAFFNTNNHIVNGLITSSYQVKVKDSNGCIAQK